MRKAIGEYDMYMSQSFNYIAKDNITIITTFDDSNELSEEQRMGNTIDIPEILK